MSIDNPGNHRVVVVEPKRNLAEMNGPPEIYAVSVAAHKKKKWGKIEKEKTIE